MRPAPETPTAEPAHAAPRDVLVLRDPKESWKRCSLAPLRGAPGVRFVTYAPELRVAAAGRVWLHPDGEELGDADRGRPLLLVDCAWRRLARLAGAVAGLPARRRLPPLATAYPRRSRTFADPASGLASIEALFAATALLGAPDLALLDGYRFAREFLARNPRLDPEGRLAPQLALRLARPPAAQPGGPPPREG